MRVRVERKGPRRRAQRCVEHEPLLEELDAGTHPPPQRAPQALQLHGAEAAEQMHLVGVITR